MRAWNIKHSIDILLAVRDQIGPFYGSEDLAILLYSIIRREQPSVVVELGTGLGACTIWMAAALRENGFGRVITIDNGSQFSQPAQRDALANLVGPLYDLARLTESGNYEECVRWIFAAADLAEVIDFRVEDIDIESGPERYLGDEPIDILFSDFNHSPSTILQMLSRYMPFLGKTSAIFIDSASTYMPSHWMLDKLVRLLNAGQIPETILLKAGDTQRERLISRVRSSSFELHHLYERSARDQNSTSLIRIQPVDIFPSVAKRVRIGGNESIQFDR
jgi:predicted O-methyltransferase YrrM